MIVGHKPNGYYVTQDRDGRKIEGESRQCVHCQYIWEYHPGSGDVRGWCSKCNGFICARPECMKQQFDMVAAYAQATGKIVSCIPFEDWDARNRERMMRRHSNLSMI